MNFLKKSVKKAKEVIIKPKKFFKKNKDNFGETTKYLIVLLIISSIIYIIDTIRIIRPENNQIFLLIALLNIISFIIIGLIFIILTTLFIHLLWVLFGAKGELEDSYRALVYSSTPSMLLGWLPFINILASLYGFYLLVISGSIVHKISIRRSLVALIIIPAALIILIFTILINMTPLILNIISGSDLTLLNETQSILNNTFYY